MPLQNNWKNGIAWLGQLQQKWYLFPKDSAVCQYWFGCFCCGEMAKLCMW